MCGIEILVAPDLYQTYQQSQGIAALEGVTKTIKSFDKLTDELKRSIDYIITLGGDGTILWAAKMFNGDFIPPMITFAQGSLGFMCNFNFDDHPEILGKVLNKEYHD